MTIFLGEEVVDVVSSVVLEKLNFSFNVEGVLHIPDVFFMFFFFFSGTVICLFIVDALYDYFIHFLYLKFFVDILFLCVWQRLVFWLKWVVSSSHAHFSDIK